MTNIRPRPGSTLPDLLQWLESPFGERHAMRIESYVDQGQFVIRCELPGVDPDNDIHLDLQGNQLNITAERRYEERDDQHSEFHYGTLNRTLLLPANCNTDEIEAEYDAGILTVRIPQRDSGGRREIPIARRG
ncbi:Hsp20/alpha crystallin family protein [Saccharopolyspora rosea]|uniref:Hsp20/alpha crystallin family protein n=1 Tax=Saccharopolyspora rosea TaxID=524884 RepID=A0ABW3FW80_9PSEU|nr:Hsp20/alpha crystallin family protein [Saccharopolyspora rosea]